LKQGLFGMTSAEALVLVAAAQAAIDASRAGLIVVPEGAGGER
jgi:hypothetical protein